MAIERSAVVLPALPSEVVECEPLGGSVEVRGLTLAQRLRLEAVRRRLARRVEAPGSTEKQPVYTESEQEALERAGAAMVAVTLAETVLGADGSPLLTASEWDAFGSTHYGAACQLFLVASRLSGQDLGDARKNSSASRT